MPTEQLIDLVFVVDSAENAARVLDDVFTRGVRSFSIEGAPSSAGALGALEVFHMARVAAESTAWPGVGEVRHVTAQVMRDVSGYRVEVTFALHDVADQTDLCDELHHFANDLAVRRGIAEYFGGLDPATDEDTRLFTGTQRGPIRLTPVCDVNDRA